MVISLSSFCLSLIRIHLNIKLPLELTGIFFISAIYDPWIASFTGLVVVMLQGFLIEKTYFYYLLLYVILGLYWGYTIRMGAARIWGKCSPEKRIKHWVVFILCFAVSGLIELGIAETLNELVFKHEGLIYYREGLFEFWVNYIYKGRLFELMFQGVSQDFYVQVILIVMLTYLIYKVFPSRNRFLLSATPVDRKDILIEQNSVILCMVGLGISLFILFFIEQNDPSNFKLVDLIHTASFWTIFFIVLGTVAYFMGTKEIAQNHIGSITVITLPPCLMIWMVVRIQNQINIRTSFRLKKLVSTSGFSFEMIHNLITTQFYQQTWLTALITTSYLVGCFIIILIIFKWNKDLSKAKDDLEDQVIERTQSLQKAQNALIENEKLVSLGRLSAEIIHEINNPLYGMLNYADILMTKMEQDRSLFKYVNAIRSGLYYVSAILKQLRGLSGTSKPNFSKINLVELLNHSLFLMDYMIAGKDIQVIKNYQNNPLEIEADPQLLQQVFINIIHNAVQAMQWNGNFTIGIAPVQADMLELSFRDEGPGIADADMEKIFTPFFTTKKPEEGMGLGLTVCEKIVNNHNGTIKVQSVQGQGTTFIIQLPVRHVRPSAK